MMNKKGQVFEKFGALATAVLVLLLVLVVGFLFMAKTKVNVTNQITATSFTNATVTLPNATTTSLLNCVDDLDLTVTTIYNGTDTATATPLGVGNYSVSKNKITMNVKGAISYSSSTKMTYSCKQADLAYNSTRALQSANYSLVTWVGLIVIVFIAVLIIGLARKFNE